MPPTVSVAAFVFGMVLILAALVGKDLKIAAIELPALSRGTRIVAGVAGVALLYIGLFDPIKPAALPALSVAGSTATASPEPATPIPPTFTALPPSPTAEPTATPALPTPTGAPLGPTPTQPEDQPPAQLPAVALDEIEYVHNVTDPEGNPAMRVDVSFTITGAQGIPCQANAYFAFPDGTYLKARSSKYGTTGGYLVTSAPFTPAYDVTDYKGNFRLQLYMPYEEFVLPPGKHELRVHVELYQLPDDLLATSSSLAFDLDTTNAQSPAPAQSIAFSNVRVVYDVTDPGTNLYGMNVFAAFTIIGYRGKTCRAIAYFLGSDGQPLKDFNGQFKTDASEVAATTDFTPGFDPALYGGASELRLFIPYDELHLIPGTHDMFVFVRVYELPSLELIGQSDEVPFRVTQN